MPTDLLDPPTNEITLQTVLSQSHFEWFDVNESSIVFRANTPENIWLDVTKMALDAYEHTHSTHCRMMAKVADCLNYGERNYGEQWSNVLDDARKFLRVQQKSISNAMHTFSKIAPENRHVDTLSLTHHELVAGIEDKKLQAELLQKAETEELTTADFKNVVARARLTDEDKALIAKVTSQDPKELTASEIKKTLKRAKRGDTGPSEPKAVIDLESDEGLQHAIEKATERLKSYDFAEMPVPVQKKWTAAIVELCEAFSPCRREKFAQALSNLAINYLLFAEAEKPARQWDEDRKEAWKPILGELQKIYRRSCVSTHGKDE